VKYFSLHENNIKSPNVFQLFFTKGGIKSYDLRKDVTAGSTKQPYRLVRQPECDEFAGSVVAQNRSAAAFSPCQRARKSSLTLEAIP
jgi:hypothetical protein